MQCDIIEADSRLEDSMEYSTDEATEKTLPSDDSVRLVYKEVHLEEGSPDIIIAELSSHINELIHTSLRTIRGKTSSVMPEKKLLKWVVVTGFMFTVQVNLKQNLKDALNYCNNQLMKREALWPDNIANLNIQDALNTKPIGKPSFKAEFVSLLKEPVLCQNSLSAFQRNNHGDYDENGMMQLLEKGVNRMFCTSLHIINRAKLSPLWPAGTCLKPSFNEVTQSFEFKEGMTDAYNKYAKHAQSSSFFQAISSLSIDSLIRCENTGYGLENRSTGAGTRYALHILQKLNKQGMVLSQMFFERSLFYDRKLHHLVKTVCYNAMPMWPKPKDTTKKLAPLLDTQSRGEKQDSFTRFYTFYSRLTLLLIEINHQPKETCLFSFSRAYETPPIVSSLENTPPSLSEVYNASVGKLELQHGVLPDKLGWANVANSHALRRDIIDEASCTIKLNSAYDSVKLWEDREQKLISHRKLDQLSSVYNLHTTYLPQKLARVTLPSSSRTKFN
ncbi:hypothetical protein EB796_022174 [Bugula neritina]|uniref:Uncharacterized protein n=1 Tax=Bugula neritina TaxID=10212 RepID=A0A7J7J084_BUGNE|nr:hypothetical protein EB796_022174 [Bugula neritina]